MTQLQMANWKKVKKTLSCKLKELETREDIHTPAELHTCIVELTCAITETMDSSITKNGPPHHQKCWWSQTLTTKFNEGGRLTQRAYSRRSDTEDLVHHEHKKARKEYGLMIESMKREHWAAFLTFLDRKSVWTTHCYASGDPTDGGRA